MPYFCQIINNNDAKKKNILKSIIIRLDMTNFDSNGEIDKDQFVQMQNEKARINKVIHVIFTK